ncbi:acyltransferase [Lysobacter sp. Hz 25]|uniref:acyltransferase n=1 Tax=Lysobacter sp. Hz 25 TaxID=3383698 RepID=UPI0038D4C0C6
MNVSRLLKKSVVLSIIRIGWFIKPGLVTRLFTWFLRSEGAHIEGMPNYLSAKIWFDGTDYSLITLGEGCTISSNVRILTHDAAINTVAKELGIRFDKPEIRIKPVRIGRFSFIGTGSIIMPGADIGAGCIVAAGSVVRGKIAPLSIVMGSPAQVVGSVTDYLAKTHPHLLPSAVRETAHPHPEPEPSSWRNRGNAH